MKEESKNPDKKNPEEKELPKHVTDDLKKTEEYGKNIVKFENELKNDTKYREYFKKYNESSWKGFVQHYAFQKALCLRYGDSYIKKLERRELKYYNEAENNLWYIQQKKLFNLQCLWRAEKATIPEIQITNDFNYWSHKIKSCPFLEPITEEEFQMFVDFFTGPNFDIEINSYTDWIDWQDYYTYKRQLSADPDSDVGISYPEWYFYYDSRMGTSELINLPDVREEKENFYLKIWNEERKKKNPPKPNPKFDRRPYLKYYTTDAVENFMKAFEDRKIIKYYQAYKDGSISHDDPDFDSILFEMQDIKENIPIEDNPDWKEAIKLAYRNYEHHKTEEQLENAYRDYLSKIKMGIGFTDDSPHEETMKSICETQRKYIIEGRVLNGEPADLNF